jgi:UDP-N-acetylmuramoyl-L-alanyl-D-glutamate--2,6-diaminopimelate ligase
MTVVPTPPFTPSGVDTQHERSLAALLHAVAVVRKPAADVRVTGVTHDPRRVSTGSVFVVYPACGIDYSAVLRRMSVKPAVIVADVSTPMGHADTTSAVVIVHNANEAYAQMCANWSARPSGELALHAVTGTKGKTTTVHLLHQLLMTRDGVAGLVATSTRQIGSRRLTGGNTTPLPDELHALLRTMRAAGTSECVIEASSIALAEERLHDIRFRTAVFTNLGSDHLEYHGGVDAYAAAKRRLFESACFQDQGFTAVVNSDDDVGRSIGSCAGSRLVTYGLESGDVRGTLVHEGQYSLLSIGGRPVRSTLRGRHNAYNLLAAYACGVVWGLSPSDCVTALERAPQVSGRMELVLRSGLREVYLDYAHTPESVEAALLAVQPLRKGRPVVALLGCSDRSDAGKRPSMAGSASRLADVCVCTRDNDYSGIGTQIVHTMVAAAMAANPTCTVLSVPDRRDAIHAAVQQIQAGGVLVLLGRGRDRTLWVNGIEKTCADADVAREALHGLLCGQSSGALDRET